MKPNALAALLLGTAHLLFTPTANAETFTLSFRASGFASVFYGLPVPNDSVAGSIVFTAASFGSPVDAINSVSLIIDGHAFQPSEVGGSYFGGGYIFGAATSGVQSVAYGTSDFLIYAVPGLETFTYATPNAYDGWTTSAVSYSISAVPEPSVQLLFAAGIAGITWSRRKRYLQRS